jgi:hypothetical protein
MGHAVIEALSEAIDNVDACLDRASVTALLAARDLLDAHVVETVGRFETDGDWADRGAPTFISWLRVDGRMSNRGAVRLVNAACAASARWPRRGPTAACPPRTSTPW